MVIDDHDRGSANTNRDRGQLILIGALALAFILLGVVVVYNGVLYTETISSSSTGQSVSHAEIADDELERGIQGVIQRENLEENPDLTYAVVESFGPEYANATSSSKAAVGSIQTVDTIENAMRNNSAIENESVRVDVDNSSIGHVVVSVDSTTDGAFEVSNEDGPLLSLDFDGSGDIEATQLDCEISSDSEQDDVRIDIATGAVNASLDNCENADFDLVDIDDEFEFIEFEDAGGVGASYELVYKDDGGDAAWTVNVTYTYESNDVTVEKEREIDVYGDR